MVLMLIGLGYVSGVGDLRSFNVMDWGNTFIRLWGDIFIQAEEISSSDYVEISTTVCGAMPLLMASMFPVSVISFNYMFFINILVFHLTDSENGCRQLIDTWNHG